MTLRHFNGDLADRALELVKPAVEAFLKSPLAEGAEGVCVCITGDEDDQKAMSGLYAYHYYASDPTAFYDRSAGRAHLSAATDAAKMARREQAPTRKVRIETPARLRRDDPDPPVAGVYEPGVAIGVAGLSEAFNIMIGWMTLNAVFALMDHAEALRAASKTATEAR
ncbi:MAG TPA: hypothetical protein VLH77_00025 [Gammaproteobacteria bacterium]|nr:hypothetical protein [Gammaproteobacteria bacterium]